LGHIRRIDAAGSVCTMAVTLSRSTPSPVTGVVATTCNEAGEWGPRDAGIDPHGRARQRGSPAGSAAGAGP
jgi:hypothetical protein